MKQVLLTLAMLLCTLPLFGDKTWKSPRDLVTITPNGDGTHKIEYDKSHLFQEFQFDVIYSEDTTLFLRIHIIEVHYGTKFKPPKDRGMRNINQVCRFPIIAYSVPSRIDGNPTSIEVRVGSWGYLVETVTTISMDDEYEPKPEPEEL